MWKALRGGSSSKSAPQQSSPDDIPLHTAIRNDETKTVKKLVDGAVGGEVAVSKTDKLGRNAIHISSDCAKEELLRILLKSLKGAPRGTLAELVNAKDNVGATPLFLATQCGSKKCVSELLKAGADPTVITAAGESVLHAPFLAPFIAKGHTTVLKELLTQPGIKVNCLDNKNVTPLQMACRKGAFDCALVLLAANADATMVKGGEPPLFSAAVAENPGLVQKLLEAGADIAQPNSSGQTLMELLNPKCEIYRVIKRHLINRPGGARKLQLFSEEAIVATTLADLPPEVLRLVERAGLPESEISAHWPVFCSIIQSIAKKTIVATAEEAAAARETRKQKNQTTDTIAKEVANLSGLMITSGEPSKIFKKMRVAGSGGFGMVFQGTGPDKKQWAIKRMPHSSDKEKLANLRESQYLKGCSHKNICAYKATYESALNHELWVIMELLEGGTLDESIGKQSEEATHFFEERHLAYSAAEMLQGLEYLHENNIVHRDLKSQNVMFTLTGDVKLIDFGSSVSIVDSTVIHKETAGSPFWMSPEMILHKPHGPATDIWSMSVCLQELANHRPPDSSSILRHMFRVATGNSPTLDKPEKWSDLMRDFLDLCMQHDPSKRPRASVLIRHKWVSTRACSQTDMAILLRKIFYARNYNDV